MGGHHLELLNVETSLKALSRELRWHRRAWLGLVLAGGTLALAGATKPQAFQELRATKILLTDPSGTVRGTIAVEADGTAGLRLNDSAGVERLAALVSGSGPAISLSEADRKIAAKLVVESGVPRLALADRAGSDRLWVALRLGSPAIQFIAPDGVARSGLVTVNDDTGVAIVSGASGAVPGLVLYDKDRKVIWSAP